MSNGSTPSFSERCAGLMWQVERFAASGSPDFRRQYVEVLPLARAQPEAKPPPRPPRAVRSHQSFRWQDRLARNAWWGPPQLRVNVAGVPDFLAMNAPSEELASTEAVSMQYSIPLSGSGGRSIPVCFQQPSSLPRGFLAMWQQVHFVPKP